MMMMTISADDIREQSRPRDVLEMTVVQNTETHFLFTIEEPAVEDGQGTWRAGLLD
jgi:hypothetical protein